MSGQVVDPALLPQLGHDGVDPGEAGPALRPLGQRLWVAVPRDLNADGIVLHLVEAGVVGGCRVEELAPQQLTVERQRRGAVLLDLGERWQDSRYCLGPIQRLYQNGSFYILRCLMTYLPVEVGEFEVEEATGEAAEAQVRAEACRAGEQRVGVHSGTLEVGHPRLMATQSHDQI